MRTKKKIQAEDEARDHDDKEGSNLSPSWP